MFLPPILEKSLRQSGKVLAPSGSENRSGLGVVSTSPGPMEVTLFQDSPGQSQCPLWNTGPPSGPLEEADGIRALTLLGSLLCRVHEQALPGAAPHTGPAEKDTHKRFSWFSLGRKSGGGWGGPVCSEVCGGTYGPSSGHKQGGGRRPGSWRSGPENSG